MINCNSCKKKRFDKLLGWICTEDNTVIFPENVQSGRFCGKHSYRKKEDKDYEQGHA